MMIGKIQYNVIISLYHTQRQVRNRAAQIRPDWVKVQRNAASLMTGRDGQAVER